MSKTNKISFRLQQAIAEETELRTNYSGRFMYGETCLAFSADPAGIGGVIAAIADEPKLILELACLLTDAKIDSLGLGQIMYFPGWIAAVTDNTEEA